MYKYYKNFVIAIYLVIGFVFCSFSQNIEITGGLNNSYYSFSEDMGNGSNAKMSYSFLLGISDLKIGAVFIAVDNYKAQFSIFSGGQGGGESISGEDNKTTLGILHYPLNWGIKDKMNFAFGWQCSYLVASTIIGTYHTWPSSVYKQLVDAKDRFDIYNFMFGLSAKVNLKFNLNEKWSLSPQYRFYYGLSRDFNTRIVNIRSVKHHFEITLTRKLKF